MSFLLGYMLRDLEESLHRSNSGYSDLEKISDIDTKPREYDSESDPMLKKGYSLVTSEDKDILNSYALHLKEESKKTLPERIEMLKGIGINIYFDSDQVCEGPLFTERRSFDEKIVVDEFGSRNYVKTVALEKARGYVSNLEKE